MKSFRQALGVNNNFEKLLYDNGTHILKFYLHIDAENLESLNMKFPEPTVDINEIKQKYHAIVEEEEEKQEEQVDDTGC